MGKKRRGSRNRFSGLPNPKSSSSPGEASARRSISGNAFQITPNGSSIIPSATERPSAPMSSTANRTNSACVLYGSPENISTAGDAQGGEGSLYQAIDGDGGCVGGDLHSSLPNAVHGAAYSQIERFVFSDEDHLRTAGDENAAHGTAATKISNWRVLWALISTNGSLKLTKLQYMSMRSFVEAISREGHLSWKECRSANERQLEPKQNGCLPHFTTLQKVYRPLLLRVLVPRSTYIVAAVDLSKAGARHGIISAAAQPQATVQIIFPSEYARSDMATGPVWHQMKTTAIVAGRESFMYPCISTSDCIDIWPLVAARPWFYGPRAMLSVDKAADEDSPPVFAENGDEVGVTLIYSRVHFPERLRRCFGRIAISGNSAVLRGKMVHSWTVHHSKRKEDQSFQDEPCDTVSERDRAIAKIFNFVSYRSPSDRVTIPVPEIPTQTVEDLAEMELQQGAMESAGGRKKKFVSSRMAEAMKKRQSALKARKAQMGCSLVQLDQTAH